MLCVCTLFEMTVRDLSILVEEDDASTLPLLKYIIHFRALGGLELGISVITHLDVCTELKIYSIPNI